MDAIRIILPAYHLHIHLQDHCPPQTRTGANSSDLGPRNWRPTLNISQIGVGVLGHIGSKIIVLLPLYEPLTLPEAWRTNYLGNSANSSLVFVVCPLATLLQLGIK
jgi:hypothetical protein